jgi:3',5'-cyclic AMP phosphodiesterase CpdA
MEHSMHLVQISDTHIDEPGRAVYGHFDTTAALSRTITAINALSPQPDLVLHTGDIASHGSVPRYEAFRDIMQALGAPWAILPGNHDDRDALRTVFGSTDMLPTTSDFLQYVLDDYPVRIVCCDSVIVGEAPGEMCPERCAWLDAQLAAAPERPTIVALHHPPFYSGMTGTSAKGLKRGGADLAAVIKQHDQVVRVLAGHVHRPITAAFGGTIAFAGPTTCYPFGMDMGSARVLNVVHEPPAFAVHAWLPDAVPDGAGLVTHVQPVGDWDPPIPLLRDGKLVLGR